MIKVVRIRDNKILATYDAWAEHAYNHALDDIYGNGYEFVREQITMMGDMVIWVKEA